MLFLNENRTKHISIFSNLKNEIQLKVNVFRFNLYGFFVYIYRQTILITNNVLLQSTNNQCLKESRNNTNLLSSAFVSSGLNLWLEKVVNKAFEH